MSGLPPRRHLLAAGGASAVLGGEESGVCVWGGIVVLWLCSHRNASVAKKSDWEVLQGETTTRVRAPFLSRLTPGKVSAYCFSGALLAGACQEVSSLWYAVTPGFKNKREKWKNKRICFPLRCCLLCFAGGVKNNVFSLLFLSRYVAHLLN